MPSEAVTIAPKATPIAKGFHQSIDQLAGRGLGGAGQARQERTIGREGSPLLALGAKYRRAFASANVKGGFPWYSPHRGCGGTLSAETTTARDGEARLARS